MNWHGMFPVLVPAAFVEAAPMPVPFGYWATHCPYCGRPCTVRPMDPGEPLPAPGMRWVPMHQRCRPEPLGKAVAVLRLVAAQSQWEWRQMRN